MPPPIEPAPRDGRLPLSFAQERLWFIAQMNPDSPAYNIPGVYRLEGPLHLDTLEQALAAVIRRHEILRTTFRMVEGQPVQVVAPHLDVPLERIDLSGHAASTRDAEAMRRLREETRRPFDLASGPLIRGSVVCLDASVHVLALTLHHVVSDRWSSTVLLRDLARAYEQRLAGASTELPALPVQYADYAASERTWIQGEVLQRQLRYWLDALGENPPVLALPTSHPRPTVTSYRGDSVPFTISATLRAALEELAQLEGVSSFMLVLAAFQVLLRRYSGQTDITVGSPVAHRTRPETEPLIGCFINTLALRSDLSGNPAFVDLLASVRETCLGAYEHQDLPFEKLVEEIHPQRDLGHAPIFQAMLVFNARERHEVETLGEATLTPVRVSTGTAKFDLTLTMTESDDGLTGHLGYASSLFDEAWIERMTGHWRILLESIVTDPTVTIDDLALLSATERRQITVGWNQTEVALPPAASLPRLVEQQVAVTPDATAVIFDGHETSYRELNARANRIARLLEQRGVTRETTVAVHVERSADLVATLLAVTKAGGAYVPLDPIYPAERIRYILEDSDASLIVTEQRLRGDLPDGLPSVVLDVDPDAATLDALDETDLPTPPRPDDLAYVIYTSGSTGRPKGVMIEHRALVNFLEAMRREPGFDDTDILVAITTVSFDIAALELFLPLVCGGRVVLADRETATDGHRLATLVASSDATVLQATPASWQLLLDAGWPGSERLRMLCGGEALSPDLARKLCGKGAALWNVYGPTETTIWSSTDRVSATETRPTIGRPIANTQLYILDARRQPVPPGVTGELWIGGAGVARGYWRREELTAERFAANPFVDDAGARMYRTGDLARHRQDGRVEYLGRTDHQVKVRGFRIELGEIEAVLTEQTGVDEVVVVAHRPAPDDVRLVAYLVCDPHDEPTTSEVRVFARARLPQYMVPSRFVVVDTLPLTPSGKADRRALEAGAGESATPPTTFVAPAGPVEERLATIWRELLQVDRVSRTDNFFDLGGHSLLAMQVIVRLEAELGHRINPRELFLQTLEQLAASLTSS